MSKLDPCVFRCGFIGFTPQHKGYLSYHLSTRIVYVTMDVNFLEAEIVFTTELFNYALQGEMSTSTLKGLSWFKVTGESRTPSRAEPPHPELPKVPNHKLSKEETRHFKLLKALELREEDLELLKDL